MLVLAVVAVCAVMAGCAPKQLTRQEFLERSEAADKARMREYPKVGR